MSFMNAVYIPNAMRDECSGKDLLCFWWPVWFLIIFSEWTLKWVDLKYRTHHGPCSVLVDEAWEAGRTLHRGSTVVSLLAFGRCGTAPDGWNSVLLKRISRNDQGRCLLQRLYFLGWYISMFDPEVILHILVAQRDQSFKLNESQHNLLLTAALRICNSLYGRVVDELRGYCLAPAFPRYRERWDLTGTLCYSQDRK